MYVHRAEAPAWHVGLLSRFRGRAVLAVSIHTRRKIGFIAKCRKVQVHTESRCGALSASLFLEAGNTHFTSYFE